MTLTLGVTPLQNDGIVTLAVMEYIVIQGLGTLAKSTSSKDISPFTVCAFHMGVYFFICFYYLSYKRDKLYLKFCEATCHFQSNSTENDEWEIKGISPLKIMCPKVCSLR